MENQNLPLSEDFRSPTLLPTLLMTKTLSLMPPGTLKLITLSISEWTGIARIGISNWLNYLTSTGARLILKLLSEISLEH
jgi:hypothetical protein